MAPTFVALAVALQAVAPPEQHGAFQLIDRSLLSPVAGLHAGGQDGGLSSPVGAEVFASVGIGIGMLGLLVGGVFLIPVDCALCALAPTVVPALLGLTSLLSATAVWGIERSVRPGVAWWPIFLTSAILRVTGALLVAWGVQAGPRPEPIISGLGLALVGGTIGEVVVARWGDKGQQ